MSAEAVSQLMSRCCEIDKSSLMHYTLTETFLQINPNSYYAIVNFVGTLRGIFHEINFLYMAAHKRLEKWMRVDFIIFAMKKSLQMI